MAFKMKGWSPFDKKEKKVKPGRDEFGYQIKEKESFTDKEETYMDRVYAEVAKNMGDSGTTYSVIDIANMTEKERLGNITDYEPGQFARMVAEAKKKIKK